MARTLIAYIIYIVGASALLLRIVPAQPFSTAPISPTPRPKLYTAGLVTITISVEDGSAAAVTCLVEADRVVADVVQVSTVAERDHLAELLGCSPG
jgi:hypothetical protein